MADLPDDVVEAAERLTRRARRARDEEAAATHRARRDDLLADHGFTARVREDDARDVLVLYPAEWVVDGVLQPDAVEDLDRAIERPLSGPADPDDWDAVAAANRAVADRVRERHGDVHGDTAAALADYMSNHLAKPIDDATPPELERFVDDYFLRNAWPSDDQRAVVDESVEHATDAAAAQSGSEDVDGPPDGTGDRSPDGSETDESDGSVGGGSPA